MAGEKSGLANLLGTNGYSWDDPNNSLYSGVLKTPETVTSALTDASAFSNVGNTLGAGDNGFSFSKLFGDKYMMGNIAGLAGTAAQLVSLPSALKNTRLQNDALKFNIATAKQEQLARNTNRAGFNGYVTNDTGVA